MKSRPTPRPYLVGSIDVSIPLYTGQYMKFCVGLRLPM